MGQVKKTKAKEEEIARGKKFTLVAQRRKARRQDSF
jgi:hypothetical protein